MSVPERGSWCCRGSVLLGGLDPVDDDGNWSQAGFEGPPGTLAPAWRRGSCCPCTTVKQDCTQCSQLYRPSEV